RSIPVVRALRARGFLVSIDTMRAPVAQAAIEAGACLVNDVSGGLADPDMAAVVAAADVDYVAMHWRGHSIDMQNRAVYADVVSDVRRELAGRVDALVGSGVAPERIILDPGLGFAKTAEHNWELLAHLDSLATLGHRLLIGASRKAFLGTLEPDDAGVPAPPDRRDSASAAVSLVCAQAGVWCVRVHDVPASRSALRVAGAMRARELAGLVGSGGDGRAR
ncbi:MAG: dihydropteroate synthase, partial [Micrococcales bacterium]|nr:dihydropteroate synthase [Micrococcales bacterium]